MSLQGKIALVTGSSRGIGRAIALELAGDGADVIVHYFRNRKAARATAEDIKRLGVSATTARAHLGHPDQIDALFTEIDAFCGGLDILVCNAASAVFGELMTVDQRAWDWTMGIMAHAPLIVARHAAERMRARGGGRIVNVSSLGAQRTLPCYGLAGTAKAAMEALTRYLAVELGSLGINVNGVSPGAVRSPGIPDQWDLLPEKDEILADIARRTPLGRFVSPEEVARVVGFLCGPGAAAIAGQTLTVDGGFSVNW